MASKTVVYSLSLATLKRSRWKKKAAVLCLYSFLLIG